MYEDRGHQEGAQYVLMQCLPDGKTRLIHLSAHALAELNVRAYEWKEA